MNINLDQRFGHDMLGSEFRRGRERLGVTQDRMAAILCLCSSRTIRGYESGERPIPGPTRILLRLLVEGATTPDCLTRRE